MRRRRANSSFATGLVDFLVENHINLRGKVIKLESLSRRTSAWGLEPELSGRERLSALGIAVESCPYLDLASVGHESVVAFYIDAKDPFSLLQMFLASNHGSYELVTPTMTLYVRKHSRNLEGDYVLCLDIAKVWVNPRVRRMGEFTRLIEQVEKSTEVAVYVESILNPVLVPFFTRRGYTSRYPDSLAPSFYRLHS